MGRPGHQNLLGRSRNASKRLIRISAILLCIKWVLRVLLRLLPRIFRSSKSPVYPYTTTLIPCRKSCKLGHLFSGKPPKWIDYPNPNRCEQGFSNICNRTYASNQTDIWCLKDIYICDGHRHSIYIRTVSSQHLLPTLLI